MSRRLVVLVTGGLGAGRPPVAVKLIGSPIKVSRSGFKTVSEKGTVPDGHRSPELRDD